MGWGEQQRADSRCCQGLKVQLRCFWRCLKACAVVEVPCPLLGLRLLLGLRSGFRHTGHPFLPFSQDDDRCEEWERHEALHEDVTRQERTTERLFEEEIELKWEKGGSGLVFYTDAQFWQEEEGGKACSYCGQYQR